jgi:hypothetical protein
MEGGASGSGDDDTRVSRGSRSMPSRRGRWDNPHICPLPFDLGQQHLGLADRAEGAVSVRVKPRAHGEQNLWYKREPEILRRD